MTKHSQYPPLCCPGACRETPRVMEGPTTDNQMISSFYRAQLSRADWPAGAHRPTVEATLRRLFHPRPSLSVSTEDVSESQGHLFKDACLFSEPSSSWQKLHPLFH